MRKQQRHERLAVLLGLLVTALLLLLALAGCATPPPRDVLIPVAVSATPPAELRAPMDFSRLPVFVSPADPKATSGLTEEGERDIKRLLIDLLARVRAWESWGDAGAR